MEEVDYCGSPELVRVIPGAGEALARLSMAGWKNVLITNQSGIGRGYFTEQDYQAVNARLFELLATTMDGVYFCPDVQPSPRRKPAPGMVLEACRDLGIDPAASWFVGDKPADIECGKAVGCRTILVKTGYGSGHLHCGADHIVESAATAADLILSF
jgi:D-glycero-D-manno-heptose 1,7-bisphosphate phosphatase